MRTWHKEQKSEKFKKLKTTIRNFKTFSYTLTSLNNSILSSNAILWELSSLRKQFYDYMKNFFKKREKQLIQKMIEKSVEAIQKYSKLVKIFWKRINFF